MSIVVARPSQLGRFIRAVTSSLVFVVLKLIDASHRPSCFLPGTARSLARVSGRPTPAHLPHPFGVFALHRHMGHWSEVPRVAAIKPHAETGFSHLRRHVKPSDGLGVVSDTKRLQRGMTVYVLFSAASSRVGVGAPSRPADSCKCNWPVSLLAQISAAALPTNFAPITMPMRSLG